jgi:hypothetical protein
MDLVDALAGNTTARSPAELSLSALFRREYSSAAFTMGSKTCLLFPIPKKRQKNGEPKNASLSV